MSSSLRFRSIVPGLALGALLALTACGGGGDDIVAPVTATPSRIEIAPNAVLLTGPGQTKALRAKVYDSGDNEINVAVQWETTRPAQITVSGDGLLTAAGTGGSSQITARIGSLKSAPLLAVHTQLPAGAVLLSDANIVGEPEETTPDAAASLSSTYRVRLSGVPAPDVGALLINTEAKVVAGRVRSVETANGVHTVTLGLLPAREMFPNLIIDEVIDLSQAEVGFSAEVRDRFDIKREGNTFTFTPKPGKFTLASAATVSKPRVVADGRKRALVAGRPFAMPPFICTPFLDGAAGAESEVFALTAPPAFTIALNPRLDVVSTQAHGLERFVLHAEPTVAADWGIKVLLAVEGKVTCDAELLTIRVPVVGPLALIIGGQFPLGVGIELGGKLTALSMGITWKASLKTTVDVGLACPGGTNCNVVKTFGPLEANVVPTYDLPSLADARLEPTVSTYAFAKASIGNPFLRSLRFDAFKVKAGAALKGNFAPQAIQAADPLYSSDYKLVSELKVGADTGFTDFASFLGLNAFLETVLEISTDLGTTPTGAVTADVAEFAFGDTVNFAVKLDPRKIGFLPLIGPYNVERILIVRHAFTLDAREVASVTALPGQTEFNIPFKPTDRGRTDEFYAFVVTKLLPVGLFSLELGRATALAPDNLRQTVQIPAQLTGPTTFTVTAESRTVDGGFVPVPDARVEISNFSGGTTCGTLDRLNARTNASGVATFTVTPTASCLQLSFFVSAAVSPTVSTVVQHVTPAVVFPVFEGDLDLVFALALPLAAHLEEVTGNLRISSVPPGPESFANVSLPNLKRVGGRLDVGNAVSVQLPALESVGFGFTGLTVSSGTLGGLLTRFEAPALKQAFSITIRDNPALRTLAIGPVRVQTSFNIFRNGFPNFEGFSSGIVVGQNLQIFDNTGFSNQTAQDFVNRVTFLEGGLGGVGRNTGP